MQYVCDIYDMYAKYVIYKSCIFDIYVKYAKICDIYIDDKHDIYAIHSITVFCM